MDTSQWQYTIREVRLTSRLSAGFTWGKLRLLWLWTYPLVFQFLESKIKLTNDAGRNNRAQGEVIFSFISAVHPGAINSSYWTIKQGSLWLRLHVNFLWWAGEHQLKYHRLESLSLFRLNQFLFWCRNGSLGICLLGSWGQFCQLHKWWFLAVLTAIKDCILHLVNITFSLSYASKNRPFLLITYVTLKTEPIFKRFPWSKNIQIKERWFFSLSSAVLFFKIISYCSILYSFVLAMHYISEYAFSTAHAPPLLCKAILSFPSRMSRHFVENQYWSLINSKNRSRSYSLTLLSHAPSPCWGSKPCPHLWEWKDF